MATDRRYIRHVFGGGWATDFGPSVDAVPDQTGRVSLPFLVDADNCEYELDGGPHKIGGLARLNSTTIESGEEIRGLVDYWRQGTSGSPSQKRVVHAGTKILKDDADGTFTSIFTGLEDGAIPSYTTFDDLLIISSSSTTDVPKSWDQTTAQDLAGTPPNFAFAVVHKDKVYAAGVASAPSTLYYSDTFDPENWTTGDSGSIQVDPGDGDSITGLVSHKGELWVFKGPYKGSIHRVTGTSSSSLAKVPYIKGIGAVAHNTIFKFRDDIGFMWSDGTVRSLNATAAFGDYLEGSLSLSINKYLMDHVNADLLKQAWAVDHPTKGQVIISLPVDSSSTNNLVLAMDYRFGRDPIAMRWAPWPAIAAGAVARVIDPTNNNQPNIFFGGNDGFVRKSNQATRAIDGSTAITATITTPFINYGLPIEEKEISIASVGISPKGNYTGTFGWQRDDNAQQTQSFDQGGGDVLGVAAANQFTLGTSQLAGSQFVDRFMDLEEGGLFRSVQYQVTNAGVSEDLEVHSIAAAINSAGWSTEN